MTLGSTNAFRLKLAHGLLVGGLGRLQKNTGPIRISAAAPDSAADRRERGSKI